jgi:hypothetical protein
MADDGEVSDIRWLIGFHKFMSHVKAPHNPAECGLNQKPGARATFLRRRIKFVCLSQNKSK